ncbi:peroxisomal enoyl-CoA-hydratase [Phellopilus nigrolimitatus]|nr:peroxisomal enoyl-CoA-hydratase [Phellopilus nigrolimitatus]
MSAVALDYRSLGYSEILVRLDEAIAVVTLNRSAKRNTYTKKLATELISAFELFDKDDRVRVVVLTADPSAPAFCSGADIENGWNLWDPEAEKESNPAHRDTGGKFTMAVLRCRKLTIIAVNGHAAGIGMTMQLPFDFRVVWKEAKLVFPFVSRGICAEAISSYLLPRLVGHSRASMLLLTGEVFTPSSVHISSLYYKIVPTREEVLPAALQLAQHLASTTSVTSAAVTKALLWRGADTPEQQHLLESRAMRSLAPSKDGEEGAKSFLEKRLPNFTATLSEDMPSWVPWWSEVDVVYRKGKL